jgi:hypothetical protein
MSKKKKKTKWLFIYETIEERVPPSRGFDAWLEAWPTKSVRNRREMCL